VDAVASGKMPNWSQKRTLQKFKVNWGNNGEYLMSQPTQKKLIQKTPGVCGGNARIRDTRIAVWTLVSFRQQGALDEELLRNYPALTPQDLEAAWSYYEEHPEEIDQVIADEQ
jgi:type III restriction enzyme